MGGHCSTLRSSSPQTRRRFIKLMLGSCATASIPGVLLFKSSTVMASWPRSAFEATTIPSALFALHGRGDTSSVRYATQVKARPHLDAGDTHVTVQVKTSLPEIESITILASSNRKPMVACFKFHDQDVESLITRIKMENKGEVVTIIKSRDRLISESTTVDFTDCGCG